MSKKVRGELQVLVIYYMHRHSLALNAYACI